MPLHRAPSRAEYAALGLQRVPKKRRLRIFGILAAAAVLAFVLCVWFYLRDLTCSMAISDARDAVIGAVNGTVQRILTERSYGSDYFVALEKGEDGAITAVTTNTAHVNEVSTEILRGIIESADSATLKLQIPLGDLLGSNLLLGRGPRVPVEITMLTSSCLSFENQLVSTGINQSRHTIILKATVDVDILIPWATVPDTVQTDILLAETVIVGRVPGTYLNMEGKHGTS